MKKKVVFVLVVMILFGVLAHSVQSQESQPRYYNGTGRGEAMIFDLIFLRPLGLAGTVIGSTAFVVSLPLTAGRNEMRDVGSALVGEPAFYNFVRPLGYSDQPVMNY